MQSELTISLSSEELPSGSARERVTFGLFSMTANERLLTVGQDLESNELRHGPHIAGYPLAEWFIWNWWRIRWEGERPSAESARRRWEFAHSMATVGEGYAWPNILVFTDGVQTFLKSSPTRNPGKVSFRYIGAAELEIVPPAQLETAIDGFIENILTRLGSRNIGNSNLHRLWNDLKAERQDPEAARFRRLEAQLGYDPDEIDDTVLLERLGDMATLGEWALGEMACDAALHDNGQDQMLSATELSSIACNNGFNTNLDDAVSLECDADIPEPAETAAWRVGKSAARSLRDRLNLDGQPVSNAQLSEFAGTTVDAIKDTNRRSHAVSFVLSGQGGGTAHVALRSKWETGRRFDLARLVGDRVLSRKLSYAGERLNPATRARSYRQKAQRAFAAELLSPFASTEEMLNGDYSEEKQNEAADHFNVSPMTIRTQLANHGCIDREDAPDIVSRSAP